MKQILVFILCSLLLCWLMFAPVYKHITIMRQALLQKEVDYLLEIGANASHGYIDQAMLDNSKQRLAERGFTPDNLVYTVTTTSGLSGTNPAQPVLRGEGITLRLSYPYGSLFQIDRLIGMTPPTEGARMAAAGMKMSEYVP
ncbi:hypothetical protein [Paenibacillus sp. y28]|uniref:hypothetical protein n=1 Tax=Paenibacillus sp. y28 TaxID=3129110 RepID=UPI003019FE1A